MNDAQNLKSKNDRGMNAMRPIYFDAGIMDVPKADQLIAELSALRRENRIPDLLLFLSYTPCLSVGARQIDYDDFLKPPEYFSELGIPLYKTVRGGGLTFHWPDQLICYPILKLAADEQNIPRYMHSLEEIALLTFADFGVHVTRKREKSAQIGLWVGDDKIASMGIRISQWVTSYGFALNLNGDIALSRYIRPCGLDVKLTTVEQQTGHAPVRSDVKEKVLIHFADVLKRSFLPISRTSAFARNKMEKVFEKYGTNDLGTKNDKARSSPNYIA